MTLYRKKTLRAMPKNTREIGKILNELASAQRRLANRLPRLQELEQVAARWDKGLCARQDHAALAAELDTVYTRLADLYHGILSPGAGEFGQANGLLGRTLHTIEELVPRSYRDEIFDDGYCTDCGCNAAECGGPSRAEGLDPQSACRHIDADGETTC